MNLDPTPESDSHGVLAVHEGKHSYFVPLAKSRDLERKLTVAREAMQAVINAGMIPVSSTKEGGPMKYSEQVRVADLFREALNLTAPKP